MYEFLTPVLNFIGRQVGYRGDEANDAGSLHAKVKNINDVMGATFAKAPWNGKSPVCTFGWVGSNTLIDDAWHDIVKITGPRLIIGGYMHWLGAGSVDTNLLKFEVDGTTIFEDTWSDVCYDGNGVDMEAHRWLAIGSFWNTARNLMAWRMPDAFQNVGASTSFEALSLGIKPIVSPGQQSEGLIITIPPGLPIQTSLSLQYKSNTYAVPINTMYGIWHVGI